MRYSDPLQAVFQLSPAHPSSYLGAQKHRSQPLCGNVEGWGPLSPGRFDFTPCFLDTWIAAVGAFGVTLGFGALWYLLHLKKAEAVRKDWHFYAKLIFLGGVFATVCLQAALQVEYYPHIWAGDFRFWSSILSAFGVAVISSVQYVEHKRSRVPNAVVLFYWLFYILVHAVKLRSLIDQKIHQEHLAYFVIYTVSLGFAIVEFGLEWLIPKRISAYEAIGNEKECPYEYATVFSVLSFSWMTPIMRYGYKQFLTQDDLWDLRRSDVAENTLASFEEAWDHETTRKSPSLWWALIRAYGGPFFVGACFKTVSDVLQFIQPQLLRYLITFVESYETDHPSPIAQGAAIAIGMFLVSVTQTVFLHQYFQRAFETGMRIKSGLSAAIYRKSMRLSNQGRATKSTGDIVNLMAIDTQRLQDISQYGQQLWSAPFQVVLCMASLYQLLGFSMMAGIVVMIVMVPINWLIARFMKRLQKRQMKNKDARIRLMTEILNNMKSIKLYAWTTAFMSKLGFIRNDLELSTLRKIGASQAFANFTWSTTPFLVSCSTFVVFVVTQKQPLTSDIVFPALTLFNLLTFPLTVFPMVISAIIEASVAVGRLAEFFAAPELQPDAVIVKPAADKTGDVAVRITDGSFTWNTESPTSALEDINWTAKKGQLSCIVGRVGAGKSSFLEALLGSLHKSKGRVERKGTVAYVAQSPWIMNASVKENILFGHRLDDDFYDQTVKACALTEDFAALPDGDKTEVGERGISLSGGQKARVTLARAVYARADVYLFDDILSAVDQHVGRHLINNVLGPRGLLSSKTRVLATNSVPVLQESDYIAFVRSGRIVEEGSYADLVSRKGGDVSNLIKTANNEEQEEAEEKKDDSSNGESKTLIAMDSDMEDDEAEEIQEDVNDLPNIRPAQGLASGRKRSQMSLRRASTVSFRGPRGKLSDEEESGSKSKQTKENMEQGKVKWSVYGEYAKTSNLAAVAVYLITLLGAQTASVGGNVWLKQWSEHNQKYNDNRDVGWYIGIYFAFGIGGAALVVVQTLILWIFCSIEASRKLHERMANAIFRSPMSFFETTPAGRILNRFSSDIYKVDEVLSRTFNMLFVNAARAFFTLAVISVSTPVFMALIIPLTFLYWYIQRYYLRTSRELKRLDSVSRSPVYAHFQESLSGVNTIRAYRQQTRFSQENEWRIDTNLKAYYPSICANRWLAVRLEFIGSIIILAAAGFAIVSVASHTSLSAGLVGLAMSYALQITQSLNWIVRQTVEVETNIVSVERVLEYAKLPSEAADIVPSNRPSSVWPTRGGVSFQNYSTRYRPGLDLVLKNIDADIKSHEKIGVVGRTGAGKSSLTLALFRIIEAADGHIDIDDKDTSKIGLMDLRQRLAIIPQDASLFEGSVRDNLDPGRIHDDTELWTALDNARLKDHVTSMDGGLDAKVQEGGSNLSQGQRQLVSLARALLTPSNILVLDEATAAVDIQTDAMLQTTLRNTAFKDRTIITIAHRINTILDSDRIIVLDKGRIAEFDSPQALIAKRGLFYELARESGLADSVPSSG